MSTNYTRVREELCNLVALHPLHSIRDRVADHICDDGGEGECRVPFPDDAHRGDLEPLVDLFKSQVEKREENYTYEVRKQLETIKHFGDDEYRTKSREAVGKERDRFQPEYNAVVRSIAESVVSDCENCTRKIPQLMPGQRIERSLKWRKTLLDADYLDMRINMHMTESHQTRIGILQPVLD